MNETVTHPHHPHLRISGVFFFFFVPIIHLSVFLGRSAAFRVLGICPGRLTSSVHGLFAFWCGCCVCSPAPAVCSLPFSRPPLAKSLSPAALFALLRREVGKRGLTHGLAATIAARGIRCDVSPVSKLANLTSQPRQSPSPINYWANIAAISATANIL